MIHIPNNPVQNAILVSLGKSYSSGTEIVISGGGKMYSYEHGSSASNFTLSSPSLVTGESYTVTCKGSAIATLTINNFLASYGISGNNRPMGQWGRMR